MASIFKRIKGKHEPYTIHYRDHLGKRRTTKGYTDKGLTEQLAAKLESEARLRLTGMIDVEQERLAEACNGELEPLLAKFERKMEINSPSHVKLTTYRVCKIVRGAEIKKLADLTRETVEEYLGKLFKAEDLGNRTYNHYVQAIDSFCNWCVDTNRLPQNPLRGIERRNTEVDVRHSRRALTSDEVVRLIAATRASGKKVQDLPPETRARAYLFSYSTGLREQEIASLTASSFKLRDNPPTVTVEARHSKHRRKDVLPLHPELVLQVRQWLKGVRPGDKLFPLLGKKSSRK